jgi:hypothetical protein
MTKAGLLLVFFTAEAGGERPVLALVGRAA